VTITQPSALSASASAISVSCNGGANGSASVSVSGGTAPYTYTWNNGGSNSTITGVSAGNYSVTVTDANGCTATAATTVGQPANALSASASASAATCFGAVNGSVNLSVSGGTASYSYAWSNGATSEDLASVGAGTYSVTVTDANGCSANASAVVTQPAAISVSTSTSPATCGAANGSVDLSVSGGSSPYSYDWSNGATTEDLSGITSGTYSVTVTDASGCTASTSASVAQTSDLSATASSSAVSCNGASDGSVSVSLNGGTSPFSYLWSNGASSAVVNGLVAGTYSVTVTDSNGCTASASASVGQPSALSVSVSAVDASCENSDGSASASVSGGTTPYSYSWSNGSTNSSATGLAAGSYSLIVTDANGCTASGSATVSEDCSECIYSGINTNTFEVGLGIWVDGGSDCALISNSTYANSGSYSVQLRDNTSTSVVSTGNLDLTAYEELTVSLSFITSGLSNGEDFWLQVSNDGGVTYTTVKVWALNTDFVNNVRQNVNVVLAGPFSASTRLRFRADASTDSDVIYIDDVSVTGCKPPLNCTYQGIDSNNFDSGLGIWTDGGTDCARSSNGTYANSGSYSMQLRDNTSTSVMSTGNIDLSSYQEVTVSLSFITGGFSTNEDFWLQLSSNGGSTYTTVQAWAMNRDFINGQRENPVVVIPGPFSSTSRLRFRCDASTDADVVYIDDVVISGCQGASARLMNPTLEEEATAVERTNSISAVSLYPNPTNDVLNIDLEMGQSANVEMVITDLTGKLVHRRSSKVEEGLNKFNVSVYDLPAGIYLMTVVADEDMTTKRFVIQR
jgi:hypothetical protein